MLNNKAFTLIEVVLSIVIITIGLAGTILTFNTAGKSSGDPMVIHQALSIGKSYLEEISAKQFPSVVPCPTPAPSDRGLYNNICDYHNLIDIGATNQMSQSIAGLEDYTIQVTIDTATASLQGLISGTQVVRIDVAVSHSLIPTVELSAYRTQY